MKFFKNKVIIELPHGYGNIKTANHIFKTGIIACDSEPPGSSPSPTKMKLSP